MEKFDKRVLQDRRKRPTPALSRFTLWGQRMTFRREEDKKRGGYVDRYSSGLLFLLILVVGLNVLDVLFTMMILDNGGWEINPVVRSVIEVYGDGFWAWKFAIVSVPLILLCLHSKFRMVLTIILGISVFTTIVVLYQIHLMICQ
ncbi:MAG: DUF5658 family protein [Thermodesulfobacteriota bacterium]|jgi:hypothetical protein